MSQFHRTSSHPTYIQFNESLRLCNLIKTIHLNVFLKIVEYLREKQRSTLKTKEKKPFKLVRMKLVTCSLTNYDLKILVITQMNKKNCATIIQQRIFVHSLLNGYQDVKRDEEMGMKS
ncbi:CLUMA_CG021453, isoform A [Clunio marinus]|uniref:CLUMA_CG021453, isoform A n=1 Tax=Clunio marinus TaxID=568069 RepID=A0A1J1JBG2_9DIPT|nr:CLUMA_CG021453, isoform A [Clunio marinus]